MTTYSWIQIHKCEFQSIKHIKIKLKKCKQTVVVELELEYAT